MSAIFLGVVVAGCNNFFTSGSSIASMTISPVSRLSATGETINFTASGTTVNGATKDVTATAKWTSSNNGVATVASGGVVTAVAAGNAVITASEDDGSASASLIVSATQLQSITITPTSPTVALSTQSTEQFTATGTFADGSTQNLTNLVSWTSGTTSVATINNKGLASLLTTGTTQITATITTSTGAVTANTTLTVD